MIQIRPNTDLKNEFQKIEDLVLQEKDPIYLNKNGYGSMVLMSLEMYTKLTEKEKEEPISIGTKKASMKDENGRLEEELAEIRKRVNVKK